MTTEQMQQNWKTKFLLIGTVVGALLGFATAFLMARSAEEDGDGPPQVGTMDALRVAAGVIGTMRGVASLGAKTK